MTTSWGASELCVVDKNTRTFNSLVGLVKEREPGIRPTPLLHIQNSQNKTTCGGLESLWWFCWLCPVFPVSADTHWYSSAHFRLNIAEHCTKYAAPPRHFPWPPLTPWPHITQHHFVALWFRMKLLMQIQLKHSETMINMFLFAPSGVFQSRGVRCPAGPPWPLRAVWERTKVLLRLVILMSCSAGISCRRDDEMQLFVFLSWRGPCQRRRFSLASIIFTNSLLPRRRRRLCLDLVYSESVCFTDRIFTCDRKIQ